MSNSRNVNCPKCGNPYIRTHHYNPNYIIYIHAQEEGSRGLKGLIKYCIVSADRYYDWPKLHGLATVLNPGYRTSKPSE